MRVPSNTKSIKFQIHQQLADLFEASLHQNALKFNLFTSILIHGPPGCGKQSIIKSASKHMNIIRVNCFTLIQDTIEKTAEELKKYCILAVESSPCILILNNLQAFSESWTGEKSDCHVFFQESLGILQSAFSETGFPVILVATSHDLESVDLKIKRLFGHIVEARVVWFNHLDAI